MSNLRSINVSRYVVGALVLVSATVAGVTSTSVLADDQSAPRTSLQEVSSANLNSDSETIVEQREPIPFPTIRRSSSELRYGSSKTVRAGINGEKQVKYRVFSINGKEVSREAVSSKIVKKPVEEVVAVGQKFKQFASRGGYFSGKKVITMVATGYSASPRENGGSTSGRTATGLKIGHGVVAVDPHYIPLGTRLYIEGYGNAVAADTGGSIKGNRIDLGHDSYRKAQAVGRRSVTVHILD